MINSLNYSESDFDEGEITISFKLIMQKSNT